MYKVEMEIEKTYHKMLVKARDKQTARKVLERLFKGLNFKIFGMEKVK